MSFPLMPQANVYPSGPVTQVSRIATALSAGASVNMPSGVRRGDLAVLVDAPYGAGFSSTIYPTGFSGRLSGIDGWDGRLLISARVIRAASEGGQSVTGADGPTSNSKILQVFRANVPIIGFSGNTEVGMQISNGDPGASNAATSPAGVPLLAIGVCGAFVLTTAGTVPTFQSFSPAAAFVASRERLAVGTRFVAATTGSVTQSCDSDDFGAGNFNACLFIPLRTN